jgi:hypothetical protein
LAAVFTVLPVALETSIRSSTAPAVLRTPTRSVPGAAM